MAAGRRVAGRSGFEAMGPKSRSTASNTGASSTSPATVRTALLGTYQVRKKPMTSSRLAASRSSMEPMGVWWYGWPGGKMAAMSFS